MLIITAVFPGEILLHLAFQIAQLMKKVDKRDVKGVSIERGAKTLLRAQVWL